MQQISPSWVGLVVCKKPSPWTSHPMALKVAGGCGPGLRRSRSDSNSWIRRTSNSSTADLHVDHQSVLSLTSVSSSEGVMSHWFSVVFRQSLYCLYCPPGRRLTYLLTYLCEHCGCSDSAKEWQCQRAVWLGWTMSARCCTDVHSSAELHCAERPRHIWRCYCILANNVCWFIAFCVSVFRQLHWTHRVSCWPNCGSKWTDKTFVLFIYL